MKIFLISNSQGTSDGVLLEQGYNYLAIEALKQEGHEVHIMVMSGWGVQDFYIHIENILLCKPDLLIAQLGIIECTQRILSNKAKQIFRCLPFGKIMTKQLHNRRQQVVRLRNRWGLITRKRTPDEFRQDMLSFTTRLKELQIRHVFVEIPHFSSSYADQYFPFINQDIAIYNQILREFGSVSLFDDKDNLDDIWQKGTVHFNILGHCMMASKLIKLIKDIQ